MPNFFKKGIDNLIAQGLLRLLFFFFSFKQTFQFSGLPQFIFSSKQTFLQFSAFDHL
jgi:hypothetical protein